MLLLDDSVATSRQPSPTSLAGIVSRWVVPGAAITAVVVRLPFLGLPAGADEAGFLQVGAQWAPGGGSLYGHYWVDRPPLLITLFRFAAAAGGIVPLRLLGCLAAALVVLMVAWSARQVGGLRASRWAAVAAAALVVSPLAGTLEVNGELLAAPFVALGLGASLAAVRASSRQHTLAWSALAGAAAVSALLVKQNMADVVVFGVVLLAARVVLGVTTRRTAGRVLAGATTGAVATVAAVGAWSLLHGTSPVGVFEATYPFRLHAARVLAAGGSQYASVRIGSISVAWLGSGLALLTLCLLLATARSRLRDPVLVALTATVAFDVVSIALGGGYWLHYLVELVVPLSIGAGLAMGQDRARRLAGWIPALAVALTVTASAAALTEVTVRPPHSDGQDVGAAIRAAAEPGDTLTTLYGEAQVNLAAGLSSPYEQLWSLPVKTLDPRLTGLDAVLDGPRAPTWLVTTHRVASWGLSVGTTQSIVETRYHPVTTIDGQTVYLLDTVQRPDPVAPPQEKP